MQVLSLRDETGGSVMHWALSDESRAKLAEVIATRGVGRVPDTKDKQGVAGNSKLPWRKAGPPNQHDDKVGSDQ